LTLLRYLHVLAMAFFVGGQLVLVAAVVPALRADGDRERLRGIARRFGWGTLAAVTVLIGTGIPLASHFHQWESGTLHVKLAFVAVVAGLMVLARASPSGACTRGRDLRRIARDRVARRVTRALAGGHAVPRARQTAAFRAMRHSLIQAPKQCCFHGRATL
jgi:uncharacterized membrane protein